jgi:hypothetical protein
MVISIVFNAVAKEGDDLMILIFLFASDDWKVR